MIQQLPFNSTDSLIADYLSVSVSSVTVVVFLQKQTLSMYLQPLNTFPKNVF